MKVKIISSDGVMCLTRFIQLRLSRVHQPLQFISSTHKKRQGTSPSLDSQVCLLYPPFSGKADRSSCPVTLGMPLTKWQQRSRNRTQNTSKGGGAPPCVGHTVIRQKGEHQMYLVSENYSLAGQLWIESS